MSLMLHSEHAITLPTWWLSEHGTHVLGLVIPSALLALVIAGGRVKNSLNRRGYRWPAPAVLIAAVLSLLAGTVHGLVCPEHFREGFLYGAFFAVDASAQLLWVGLVMWRPSRWLVAVGLFANVPVVLLWVVTRTIGIPLGPEAGVVEGVGFLDAVSTVAEVGIVVGCGWLLIRGASLLLPPRPVATQAATPG